jgi:Rrf2 family protein
MKFSSTEEYGLRCMLQIAKKGDKGTTTITELSQMENLTSAYVAKILSILRKGGLIQSIRGQSGGYQLAKSAAEINVNEVLEALGGKLFTPEDYCQPPLGGETLCVHSTDCAVRSLLFGLQTAMAGYLRKCRLSDLVRSEPEMEKWVSQTAAGTFGQLPDQGHKDIP